MEQVLDRLLVGEGHEAEAAGGAGEVVVHDGRLVHLAELLEVLLKGRGGWGGREVSDGKVSGVACREGVWSTSTPLRAWGVAGMAIV